MKDRWLLARNHHISIDCGAAECRLWVSSKYRTLLPINAKDVVTPSSTKFTGFLLAITPILHRP